ncbi:hypothetical protein ABEW00_08010 [Rossellomorea vietnamensis]|uniref:hypothetical protein n=1 Tax=Rossellomorea vietnamensis TaxID=218284 RepID=UPI003D2A6B9E
MEKNDILISKTLSEAIKGQVENKALLELLKDKGIVTQKEYHQKFIEVRDKINTTSSASSLGISVEEFRDLMQSI